MIDMLKIFILFNQIANPLNFKKSGNRYQVPIFGEMGIGKSTTGNYLIKENLNLKKKKAKKNK